MTNDSAALLLQDAMIIVEMEENPREALYESVINSQDASVEVLLAELNSSSSNRMESLLVHPIVQQAMRGFAKKVLYELKRELESM